MTVSERRGLKLLQKRVHDGKLVVLQTDKSGRFAVRTLDTYTVAGMKHTSKDTEVNLEMVKENQSKLNGHVSIWIMRQC